MIDNSWQKIEDFDFEDITYHLNRNKNTVRIAFDRPDKRNAFRPQTVDELLKAFAHANTLTSVGAIIFTGNGPSTKDGGWAFSSGGDQSVRGASGYMDGPNSLGRLHILEVQRLIRFTPKVVIAVVPGWAVGGGHSLHVVCDLTLASQNAIFQQKDADVASFDAAYGSAYLAKNIGQKKAREIFFLGRQYTAREAFDMGMVNGVFKLEELDTKALEWAEEINSKSPTAIRMLKYAFNMTDDGLVGQQLFAGEATRLAYATDEAKEGREAFLEKRKQDFSSFPWYY